MIKIKNSIYILISAVISFFIFSGCNNFLNGNLLKDEINELVDYEKAPYETIEISTQKDEIEKIIPPVNNYDKSYKKGDSIKISCTVSSQYVFLNWKAEPAECVTFENENDSSTTMHIVKSGNGKSIKIFPLCEKIPTVIKFTPDFSNEGVYANSEIRIVMNTSMETAESEINFDNIKITAARENINYLYEAPVLLEDKKTIRIIPKSKELYKAIEKTENGYLDISVDLSNVVVSIKEKQYPVKCDSEIKYRAKLAVEVTPPAKIAFNAAKEEFNLLTKDEVLKNSELVLKDVNSFEETDFEKNYLKDNVCIYGNYYDAESGIASIVIEETYTHSREGAKETRFTQNSWDYKTEYLLSDIVDKKLEGPSLTFTLNYKLKSEKLGAVSLKVYALDSVGNESKAETFSVIKINRFNVDEIEPYTYSKELAGHQYVENDYNDEKGRIKIDIDQFDQQMFGLKKIKTEMEKIECVYKKENVETLIEFEKEPEGYENKWVCNLGDIELKELEFQIRFHDINGNIYKKDCQFPGTPVLVRTVSDSSYVYMYFRGASKFYYIKKVNDSPITYNVSSAFTIEWKNNISTPITPENYCYVISVNGGLVGDKLKIESQSIKEEGEDFENLVIKSINLVSAGQNTGKYIAKVEIDPSLWDIYEDIQVVNKSSGYYQQYYTFFKQKETIAECTKIMTEYLWNNSEYFTLYGTKKDGTTNYGMTLAYSEPLKKYENSVIYDNKIPTVGELKDAELSYNKYLEGKHLVNLFFKDVESGINRIDWCFKDNDSVIYSDCEIIDDNTGSIKMAIPLEKLGETGTLIVRGFDNNNNFAAKEYAYNIPAATNLEVSYDSSAGELDVTNKINKSEIITTGYYASKPENQYAHFYYFDSKELEWVKFSLQNLVYDSDYNSQKIYKIPEKIKEIKTGVNIKYKFIKVDFFDFVNFPNQKVVKKASKILFTGTTLPDPIRKSFIDRDSNVLLSSNAYTLVQTFATSVSYEECKDWDYEKWARNNKELNTREYTFSENPVIQAEYPVKTSEIQPGQCYVVAVTYADGTVELSTVKVKQ